MSRQSGDKGWWAAALAVGVAMSGCAAPQKTSESPSDPTAQGAAAGVTENGQRVSGVIAWYQMGGENGWPLIWRLKEQLETAIPWSLETSPAEVNEFDLVYSPREGEEARREKAILALDRLQSVGFWETMDRVAAAPRFVRPAQPGHLFDWEFPEFGWIRYAARASGARLRVMLEREDAREAERSLTHVRALARMGSAEPFMWGGLLGNAVDGMSAQIIREWMIGHAMSEAMLNGLRRGLASAPLPRVVALETERMKLRDTVEKMYEGPSVYGNLVGLNGGARPGADLGLYHLVPVIADRSDALGCAETVSARMLAVGAMPTHLGLMLADDVDATVRGLPRSQLVVQTLAPSIGRFLRPCAFVEAQREGVRAMVAIELYRREHGVWPRALSQLAPAYVEQTPRDPYTGEMLRYRIEGDGYVLYSVGLDGTDDGGREHPEGPEAVSGEVGKGFDLVFRARK